MKKPSALFFVSIASAFFLGGISTWLLFREKPVQLRVIHRDGGIRVYTFYEGLAGNEVFHGWSYDSHSDGTTEIEDQARYVDGKQVSSTHKVAYHSNMPDPAWAFTSQEPNKSATAQRP